MSNDLPKSLNYILHRSRHGPCITHGPEGTTWETTRCHMSDMSTHVVGTSHDTLTIDDKVNNVSTFHLHFSNTLNECQRLDYSPSSLRLNIHITT